MLKKCNSVLLLTEVDSFASMYKQLAEELEVDISVESDWNLRYRLSADVIILGSKYLEKVHPDYYSKAVIILKEDEKPISFIKKGITKFIFNYHDLRELALALFYQEPVYVNVSSRDLQDVVASYSAKTFSISFYEFDFVTDTYRYKGKPIYLSKSQKRYLADWLLGGRKDNKKRQYLFTLRKKFGEEFLADVDRHGKLKGGKDEQ